MEVFTVVVNNACLHNTTKNCECGIVFVTCHMTCQFWFATQNNLVIFINFKGRTIDF